MDNRIFDVNGRTKEQLLISLQALLLDEYGKVKKVTGWYLSQKKGLVLTWWIGEKYKATPFTNRLGKPDEISHTELAEILFEWLNSAEAAKVECVGWDADADHDGSNERGWRLYTEKWGHVEEESLDHYSIAAFKPAYLWYGK